MLALLVMIVLGESSKKRINWYPSFSVKHKIPFGSYVAYKEAQRIFDKKLIPLNQSPYVFLKKHPNDSIGTMLYYNSDLTFGETNLNALLDWVDKGNSLFLSGKVFDKELLDTLHIKPGYYFNTNFDKQLKFNLSNPKLQIPDTVVYDKSATSQYFLINDDANRDKITELGRFYNNKQDTLYNFIKLDFGKGKIYLHSFPYAFTNYFILKNNRNLAYFEGVLSYVNLQNPVYWDTYYKNGSRTKGVFEYILSNDAFLWAYRLTFIGLLLYVLFEGKRKQKPIPVVNPLRNESLEFSKTIADMYLQNKEHRLIALKHIQHFMDYVRTKLHIDTRKWNKELMENISEKTKTSYLDVEDLFEMIDFINNSDNIDARTVLELEKMINKVKK